MIKLKDILTEAVSISTNTDSEAYEKYKQMYKSLFPDAHKKGYNITNTEGYRKWYGDVKKWFVDKFRVDDKTWKQLSKAYDPSRTWNKSGVNKISFKGKTYTMSTGMDDWEYTFDVLVSFGYIKYKTKEDPAAERKLRLQQMMAKLNAD